MPKTIADCLHLPGKVERFNGFVSGVEERQPTDRDRESAKRYNKPDPGVKYILTINPNGCEAVELRYDPQQFPTSQLMRLHGAFVTLEVNGKPWASDDGKRSGIVYYLNKVAEIHLDATGQEYRPGTPPPTARAAG